MLLNINIIGFFSRSEWIDIGSGMMTPLVLLIISFFIQKKQIKDQTRITEEQFKEQIKITEGQFKEQIKITEEQFKEQIKITKDQFKEQNELSERQRIVQNKVAEKQLKEQNEIAVNKEKRMLATQLRLSKYEEFYVSLQESIELNYMRYKNTYLYDTNHMTPEKFKELDSEIVIKKREVERKQQILLSFCPILKEYWNSLFWSYVKLDGFITDNITGIKLNISEQFIIEYSNKKFDTMSTKEYRAYTVELKYILEDFQSKENALNKIINDSILNIMNDLEIDL